jgi:hypothetical protein
MLDQPLGFVAALRMIDPEIARELEEGPPPARGAIHFSRPSDIPF